uniref:Uncharacterized protein n=1 Tax=Ditylenchus dipsaci TaxID=166011 RepID=A0A915DGS3_9BILA
MVSYARIVARSAIRVGRGGRRLDSSYRGLSGSAGRVALYALCLCDAFLIFMVVLYHSIEATGILITGQNVMWNEQDVVPSWRLLV